MSDPHLRLASLENDYEKLALAYRQEHLELLALKQKLEAERAKVAEGMSLAKDMIRALREVKSFGTATLFEISLAALQAPGGLSERPK
jgi:hypothetical protein